ncbi:hypothetical protein D3C78_1058060 [compost metagenome]
MFTLYQRRRGRALQVHLNKGETAQPGHVQAVGGQRLDHCRVVGDRHELDLHAQLLFQVFAQWLELAQQLSWRLVRDGADLQGIGRLGQEG